MDVHIKAGYADHAANAAGELARLYRLAYQNMEHYSVTETVIFTNACYGYILENNKRRNRS